MGKIIKSTQILSQSPDAAKSDMGSCRHRRICLREADAVACGGGRATACNHQRHRILSGKPTPSLAVGKGAPRTAAAVARGMGGRRRRYRTRNEKAPLLPLAHRRERWSGENGRTWGLGLGYLQRRRGNPSHSSNRTAQPASASGCLHRRATHTWWAEGRPSDPTQLNQRGLWEVK